MAIGQTRDSKQAQEDEASKPEWIDGRFSCLLECPQCQGDVAVAGKYRVQDDRHFDPVHGESGDYENCFRPDFFSESPHVIELPRNTPASICVELEAAFRLFWVDAPACANRIRSSLEALLTAQKVQRTTGRIVAKGKRRFLTLHDRLLRFGKKQPAISDSLMAVKWLGNAGSHPSPITDDDLLDAFEIIEHALEKLYSKRDKRVAALVREINRRKAPRSPRRFPR